MLNIFYSRSTAIVFGTVFLILSGDCGNFCFLKKIFSKSSYIYVVLFYPKTINFHKSGIVGNVLSIRLQYTLSFKSPDFGLRFRCLVTITPIGYSIKFKASIWNFLISETGRNYNSLFKLAGNNWVEQNKIMEQKKKIRHSWVCTFWAS